jgi:hypothetical protein
MSASDKDAVSEKFDCQDEPVGAADVTVRCVLPVMRVVAVFSSLLCIRDDLGPSDNSAGYREDVLGPVVGGAIDPALEPPFEFMENENIELLGLFRPLKTGGFRGSYSG